MLAKGATMAQALVGRDPTALRAVLEAALVPKSNPDSRHRAALSRTRCRALCTMPIYASTHLAVVDENAQRASAHGGDRLLRELPSAFVTPRRIGKFLADWMLTKKAHWRKSLSGRWRVSVQSGQQDAQSRQEHKRQMLDLLRRCAAVPGLAGSARPRRRLPPAVYDDTSWSFVAAMLASYRASRPIDGDVRGVGRDRFRARRRSPRSKDWASPMHRAICCWASRFRHRPLAGRRIPGHVRTQ